MIDQILFDSNSDNIKTPCIKKLNKLYKSDSFNTLSIVNNDTLLNNLKRRKNRIINYDLKYNVYDISHHSYQGTDFNLDGENNEVELPDSVFDSIKLINQIRELILENIDINDDDKIKYIGNINNEEIIDDKATNTLKNYMNNYKECNKKISKTKLFF